MWTEVTFLGSYPSGYTYHVPPVWEGKIHVGHMVVAPLRKRRLTGIVTRTFEIPPREVQEKRIKPILYMPFDARILNEELIHFYAWCARYYKASLGRILKSALPLPKDILKGETVQPTPVGHEALKSPPTLTHLINDKEGWEKLLDWTDRGWITWEYPNFTESFTPTSLSYILTSEIPAGTRIGPKEKEIIDFVAEKTFVKAVDVKSRFPHSGPTLKRLLQKKVLQAITQKEGLLIHDRPGEKPPHPVTLSHEQELVLNAFRRGQLSGSPSPLLLHGVTGSGKTELYIRCIQETIEAGKSSIVLVPEIVLTPQLISRIQTRCSAPLVTWHSRLTAKERWRQWLMIHRENPVIVVGARSAIFLPLKKLGLIIVDEEHDPSFKQEEGLLYHARDVAVVRARHQSCALILGSATPSIESFHNVKTGKFQYGVLTRRPTGQPLPMAEIIDLKQEGFPERQTAQGLMISRPLREALLKTFSEGQQSLLFLNRRGYARFLTCTECGETLSCPHCSVSLVLHQPQQHLRCHYCGYSRPLPEACEACGGRLIQMGGGTQRLEEEVKEIIPEARVTRLDRDVMQTRRGFESLLSSLKRGEIDILIGTQMIVKGHDYPGITLMGVIMADHALRFPDFRASERTFQLLTQASGRCGRGNRPGRVLIQTLSPEHYSIRHATHHDFIGFYEEEIRYRRELRYPPFTRLAVIRITGRNLNAVTRQADRLVAEGKRFLCAHPGSVTILGPAPALLSRLKDRHRWQIILKSEKSSLLHQLIDKMFGSPAAKPEKGTRLQVEFDPVQLV